MTAAGSAHSKYKIDSHAALITNADGSKETYQEYLEYQPKAGAVSCGIDFLQENLIGARTLTLSWPDVEYFTTSTMRPDTPCGPIPAVLDLTIHASPTKRRWTLLLHLCYLYDLPWITLICNQVLTRRRT